MPHNVSQGPPSENFFTPKSHFLSAKCPNHHCRVRTGAAKHFSLPYGAPEARETSSTHTHTQVRRGSTSNNGTGCVCVCVCWSGGRGFVLWRGHRGSIVSDWKAEVLGGGSGKVKGKLYLEHLRSSIPNILTCIWMLTYTVCYIQFQRLCHYAAAIPILLT